MNIVRANMLIEDNTLDISPSGISWIVPSLKLHGLYVFLHRLSQFVVGKQWIMKNGFFMQAMKVGDGIGANWIDGWKDVGYRVYFRVYWINRILGLEFVR